MKLFGMCVIIVSLSAVPASALMYANYATSTGQVATVPAGITFEEALAAPNDGKYIVMLNDPTAATTSLTVTFPVAFEGGRSDNLVFHLAAPSKNFINLTYLSADGAIIGGFGPYTGTYGPGPLMGFSGPYNTYITSMQITLMEAWGETYLYLDALEAWYHLPLPVNIAPVAADDAAQTEAGVAVAIPVLGNDHDDDGDVLTVSSVGAAAGGSAAVNTDGTVTYTPDAGFTGLDQFLYTIDDGNGGTSTATVFVTVSPRNVLIDIKPGSYPNSINLGSNGVVPLAILSEADFDATTVDPATVSLAGATVAMRGKGNRLMASTQDVNADGLIDLVLQVETENLDPTQLQGGHGTIVGTTYDGAPIIGSDEINIVPQ